MTVRLQLLYKSTILHLESSALYQLLSHRQQLVSYGELIVSIRLLHYT